VGGRDNQDQRKGSIGLICVSRGRLPYFVIQQGEDNPFVERKPAQHTK
jgi:hypothetical protein